MNRDLQLVELRPEIQTAIVQEQTSDLEAFQNKTLRPILKFQHQLLIAYFKKYITEHHGNFSGLEPKAQKSLISNALKNDQSLQQHFRGMVLGMLTLEEFDFFSDHRAELGKRISQMISQRLSDTLVKD